MSNKVKIIKVKNYEEMSKLAAEIILTKVKESDRFTLGLATGSTPEGLYQNLAKDHAKNKTDYQHVTTFNLDEYVGLSLENEQSYYYFMNHHLFQHINVKPENIHIPKGSNKESLDMECQQYESMIEQNGGVDLQVLGIGLNGHIGFNEPGTSFESKTHIVKLDDSTRQANSRFFDSIDEVPTHAITMGISTIMNAREILMLISGKGKAETFKKLNSGEITEDFPASILNQHDNITVIVDEDASEGYVPEM